MLYKDQNVGGREGERERERERESEREQQTDQVVGERERKDED